MYQFIYWLLTGQEYVERYCGMRNNCDDMAARMLTACLSLLVYGILLTVMYGVASYLLMLLFPRERDDQQDLWRDKK